MPSFHERLKERHVAQWALAYLGGAWLTVQVLDALADPWGIPTPLIRAVTVLLAAGFFGAVVVAWYHGEKGRQTVSGVELLILAGIAGCGGLLVSLLAPDRGTGGADEAGTPEAPPPAVASAPPNTVAVLPFLDLSPDGSQQHFGDGIADEIISRLTRDGRLRVAGRASSFAMRDRTIADVGDQLGVASVLQGSIRTDGGRILISASLADVSDGFERWSRQFDRESESILQTQAEIAAEVVGQLTGEAAEDVDDVGTIAPEAYELYALGRAAWDRRDEADLRQALDFFEEAIELAPDFARARSGIADTYAVMGFYQYLPPDVAFPEARRQAEAALELDPALPEALATLAYVQLYGEWDWEAAEEGFRAAIEAGPNYATAHQWSSNLAVVLGRFDQATREARRAVELDRLSLIAQAVVPWTRYYARDYRAARVGLDRLIAFDPDYMLAHYWKGWVQQITGDAAGAVASQLRAVALSDSSDITLAGLADAYASSGREPEARDLLARLTHPARTPSPPAYEIAKVYVTLGEIDDAFEWFERAYRERANQLVFIAVDPEVDAIREDPRFADLLDRMGLAPVAARQEQPSP